MLSLIGRNSVSTQMRAAMGLAAAVCALGALVPDSNIIPFHKLLETSRNVQAATEATRWLFLSGALVFACVFAAWHWFRQGIAAGVRSLTRWSNKTFWWLVCGLAIGLRLPVLFLFAHVPLMTDGLWYHKAAISIAAGRGFQPNGTPTAYRPPGYSTLLALTYRLFGPSPEWAYFWGLVATGIILLTTYRLADRLHGKTVARIATLIIAFYPALILYTGQPISDLVFTAGLMVVWYMVTLHPPYRWLETIGIGVAVGLLTLTRGVSLGLFLVVPLLWLIKQANFGKLILHSIALTSVFAVSLLPWIVRNHAIFGTPVLTTNMGTNLYIGNHVNASGTCDIICEIAVPVQFHQNLAPNEAQVDRFFLQKATQFILAQPLEALFIMPKKILHLFLLEVNCAQTLLEDYPPLIKYSSYGISQLFYVFIAILFILRLLNLTDATTLPRGVQWTSFIIIAYFVLVAMVFFGMDRYRLPLLPWMIIESSVVVAWLGDCRTAISQGWHLSRRSDCVAT